MLELLHAEWARHGPLPLAFDGDGTLWTGDVAETIWHALLAERSIRPAAHAALVRECVAADLDADGDAHALCMRITRAYLDGTFSEERICEIQAWVFAGWTAAEIQAFVDRVLFDGPESLATRYIAETRAIVEAARAASAPVFVVSASPKHVVERAAAPLGFAPHEVLGSQVLWRDGRVLPDVERPICYGPGKVHGLERVLQGRPLLAAFGDNVFDVPMLHHARFGVMVRPKARLLALPDIVSFHRLEEA